MASHYSLSKARFTTAIDDLIVHPRIRTPAKTPIIYMAGGGDTALTGFSSAKPVIAALVEAGFSVFMPSVPYFFGNAMAVSRIDDALTYARANGCTNAPPVVMGVSNGSICATQWTRTHACTALVTFMGVVDLEYARTNDILSTRALIDAAWGVTYPAALPAHADLWTDRGLYYGKAIQTWDASNDPFDNPAQTMAQFGNAVGAEFHSLGAVGHTDVGLLQIDPAAVVRFVRNHTGE